MMKKWLVGMVGAIVIGFGGMGAVQADNKNCGDFNTGEEVYEFWTSNGYHANNDPHGLDRDSDGLPCESLTSGIAGKFQSYEESLNGDGTADNEAVEEEATETGTEESTEEGDALPVTATSYPTMMLFGLATSAIGAAGFFLYRRRTVQA